MKQVKLWDMISAAVMLLGAVVFAVPVVKKGEITVAAGVGIVLFIIGIVIGILKVRCPFCKQFLGLAGTRSGFCPCCGKDLKE